MPFPRWCPPLSSYRYVGMPHANKIEVQRFGMTVWPGWLERAFADGPGKAKETEKQKAKKTEKGKKKPKQTDSTSRLIKQNDACVISRILGKGVRMLFS